MLTATVYGLDDRSLAFSDPLSCERIVEQLHVGGAPYELHEYPGVGHAFLDGEHEVEDRAIKEVCGFGAHDPEAVSLAWERTDDFLDEHLLMNERINAEAVAEFEEFVVRSQTGGTHDIERTAPAL